MDHKTFEQLVDNRLAQCKETLCAKGEEYSRDGDRLHNFKDASWLSGETPEKTLVGMYLKHIVSVLDIVRDVQAEGKVPSRETISEKFGDSINYLLLLEGLVEERRAERECC